MKVFYTCRGCGLSDRSIVVADRRESESQTTLAARVLMGIQLDHADCSPACRSRNHTGEIPGGDGYPGEWVH